MRLSRNRKTPYTQSFGFTLQISVEPVLAGVHWIMHEHDADINDPSCPHCHAKEKNWKLDIYSGKIFDYTNGKHYIKNLSKSEMKKLWRQKGFLTLVVKERKWYSDNYETVDSNRYPPLPSLRIVKKHGKYYTYAKSTRHISSTMHH